MAGVFLKRVRIHNRLRTSINPGSNDEGDGYGGCNEPNEKQQILHMQCAFLYNLYEHDRKVPFATMFGGLEHRNKLNFLSELG